MGFSLSGIVSDIKSLASDPGKVAKDICDAVLPQSLKAVGDVIGGAIDVEIGNPLQALSHMADALKDLPQMAQGLPAATTGNAASTPAGTAAAEPTPPPARAPSLQQAISQLTALAGGGGSMTPAKPASTPTTPAQPASTMATPATVTATAPGSAPTTAASPAPAGAATAGLSAPATPTAQAAAPGASPHSSQVTLSISSNGGTVSVTERYAMAGGEPHRASTTRPRGWHSTTAGAAVPMTTIATPGASSPQNGTSVAAAGTATATATTGSSTPTGTTATGSSTPTGTVAATATATGSVATGTTTATAAGTAASAAPSSLPSLMSMSNDQFMQAVTSGNIPADVANDPSAMAEIQARMNQITQMNQLVTSMMAAMHQMQMAIIQNIRV